MTKKSIKHSANIQIGLWQQHEHVDVVWCEVEKISQNPPRFLHLKVKNLEQLLQQTDLPSFKSQFHFISALLPHNIWHKTLILPNSLNSEEAEQQMLFTLKNELPIPLDEAWYDYTAHTLKQGYKLEIFAVKKNLAINHTQHFLPWKVTVLDNAAKSVIRAITYLLGKPLAPNALLIYQDTCCDLIVFDSQQITHSWSQKITTSDQTIPQSISKIRKKPTALYTQFCARHNIQPEVIYYYADESLNASLYADLPKDWRHLTSPYPLIALGNALWNWREIPPSARIKPIPNSHLNEAANE